MSWLKRRLPKKRWKRVCIYIFSTLLILVAADMILVQCWRRIEISPETTNITSPINAAGFPDYLAAINLEYGKGVTLENNAMPLLLKIMGTEGLPESTGTHSLPLLGLAPQARPPLQLSLNQWCAKNSIHAPGTAPATRDEQPPATGPAASAPPPPAPPTFSKAVHPENQGNQIATLAGPPDPNSDEERLLKIEDELRTKPWTRAQNPLAARWIATQSETFRLAHEATDRPRCFLPFVADSDDPKTGRSTLDFSMVGQVMGYIGHERLLADLLATDAMRCIGEGDPAGFERDVLAIKKLARLTGQGPTLIENLVAVAVDSLASHTIDTAATRVGFFSATQSEHLLSMIDALPPLQSGAHALDTCERWFMLDTLCFLARSGHPIYPLHVNAALRDANQFYDQLAACYRLPTYSQQKAAYKTIEDESKKASGFHLSTIVNPTHVFTAILTPSLNKTIVLWHRDRTENDLARVALALAAYRGEHGSYPESLAALTPAYLKAIPLDGFIDAPLKYRTPGKGYLLYSVNSDETDDGGTDRAAAKGKTWDIVVRAGE